MELTILIVEDEEAIREMLLMVLKQSGLKALGVGSAEEALQFLADKPLPDLLVLDWMLPGISGIKLTQRLKKDDLYQQLPVILLTARGEEEDKIKGLNCGADDYMTKPFSPKELIARIKAVMRRNRPKEKTALLTVGRINLDQEQHRLSIDNQSVNTSPTEFRLMQFFMTHQDKVYTRTQLLDYVWGRNTYVEERTVDVHIRRLRKILAHYQCDTLIQTVRGFGYRFSLVD